MDRRALKFHRNRRQASLTLIYNASMVRGGNTADTTPVDESTNTRPTS